MITPEQIKNALISDFNNISNSREFKEFNKGLDYKSAKTRETDLALVEMLLSKCKFYLDGWIKSNLLESVTYQEQRDANDREIVDMNKLCYQMNDSLNGVIKRMKDRGQIDGERLNELRQLEKMLRE